MVWLRFTSQYRISSYNVLSRDYADIDGRLRVTMLSADDDIVAELSRLAEESGTLPILDDPTDKASAGSIQVTPPRH